MKCASCGAAVHPSADFCRVCGADAPKPSAETAPRLRGMDALRAIRIPGASSIRLPHLPARRTGAAASALPMTRSSMPSVTMPRLPARGTMVAAAAVAGIVLAFVLVQVSLGAGDGDATARELTEARAALQQRDAKIASLEGTVATGSQAQSALQGTAKAAQDENAALKAERDDAKLRVSALETKLMETQGQLTDLQKTSAKQATDIRSLANCLNGTAVGLAFGRTNRWSSADFALAAVSDACKASESLLQR